MSDLDRCTVATRGFLVTRALHARAAPSAVVRQFDAIHVAFSGTDAASFNTAFITEPLEQPREEIRRFVSWAAGLGFGYHVYLRDDMDAATEEALRSAGLTLLDTEPWMVHDPVPIDPTDPSASSIGTADVRRVGSADDLDLHLAVAAEAFEMDRAAVAEAFPPTVLDDDRLSWFTRFDGDRPVATMATCRADAVLTLQNVGTVADARGRGHAAALTRYGQFLAHQLGCVAVAVQASPMGERLYRRLGFRVACHYRVFAGGQRNRSS